MLPPAGSCPARTKRLRRLFPWQRISRAESVPIITFLMVAPGLAPVDLKTCAQLMIDAAQELIAGLRAVMTLPEPVEGDEDFD